MQKILMILTVLLFAGVSPAFANLKTSPDTLDPSNIPPPPGAILDLAGTPVFTGAWHQYSVNFMATTANTDIAFLFRNDPGFTGFDDVSVSTGGGPNLFLNPGFEANTGAPPTNWNFENIYGAGFAGAVTSSVSPGGCLGMSPSFPHNGNNAWCDGATQAYDAIDQVVATTLGDTYTVTFWQNNVDSTGVDESAGYQQISTNGHNSDNDTGGNGIDTLVYAGATIPAPVPEPASVMLMASGVLGLGITFRRKFDGV